MSKPVKTARKMDTKGDVDLLKLERNLMKLLDKHSTKILFGIVLICALALRYMLIDYISSDMSDFLLGWVEEIKAAGNIIEVLSKPIGNYGIAYLLLLALAAKIPIDHVHMIKLYSIIADFAIAIVVGLIICEILKTNKNKQKFALLASALVLFSPLVIINSAFWGQCDSIYTAFSLLGLYLMMKDRWTSSFLMLGIAFCFKLQALFLLPFYIIAYISLRKFSVLNFLLIPMPIIIITLPAAFLQAKPFLAFEIYFGQMQNAESLFYGFFNASGLLTGLKFDGVGKFLIVLTVCVFVCLFMLIFAKRKRFAKDDLLMLAFWCVMTCLLLLPYMHERYGYVGEILGIAWFVAKPQVKRFVPVAIFTISAMVAYISFLSGYWLLDVNKLCMINIAAYLFLTFLLVKKIFAPNIEKKLATY